MERITIIDGFRGFFLIFMMIMHSNELLNAILGKLNHHYFGWVEDAQGFVFLSGLVVGLVYTRQMERRGTDAMRRGIWKRIGTIYSHQAGLIMTFLLAALMLPTGIEPMNLAPYEREPVVFTAASLMLVTGSRHMGILPMYIFFMMATPFVLRALARGHFAMLSVISVSLWLFAQTGLPEEVVILASQVSADAGHPIRFGIFFNIFAWQIVFFLGLVIGYLTASGRMDTSFLYTPDMERAFFVAVAAVIALGLFDRVVFDYWIGVEFRHQVLSSVDRGNFSSLYLVAFLIDLFVIVWLLGPGRTSHIRIVALASALMHRVFTFGPLVFLGQHSLHVFSAHILCVYVLALVLHGTQLSPLVGNLLILLSPLPLYLAAWGHQVMVSRDRAKSETARAKA